jgi:tetratricopeptide (TPR) repeat protein
LHAQALAIHSSCLFRQGNFPGAIRLAKQSLEMARTVSDRQTEALSLAFLGVTMAIQGNIAEGGPLLEQALAIYRLLGDKIGQAGTTEWLSANNTDMERALAYAQESVALGREMGDLSGLVPRLCMLARLTFWNGDLTSPSAWLEEALSISRQLNDRSAEAYTISTYGNFAYWQGNYPQAIEYHEEAIKLNEKIGDHYQALWAKANMAYAVFRQGDIQKARALFADNIQSTQKANLTIAFVYTVEGIASLYVKQAYPERAIRLFAWADAMRDKIGDHRPPIERASVERDLAVLHSQLNDSEFDRLTIEGQRLTVEEAVALALQEIHE